MSKIQETMLRSFVAAQAWRADRQPSSERGAGLAEYALLLLLITIVTAGVITTLGNTINGIFSETKSNLE